MTQDARKKEPAELTGAQHKKLGIDLFNFTWTLISKPDRTQDDIDTMIHAAHSSRYHWSKVPEHGPKEIAIGEWQLSRVYAILKRPEAALWHAERCLVVCEDNGLKGWLLAFAHEAAARAYAAAGDRSGFDKHYSAAQSLADTIDDKDDRDLLISDLKLQPWFGFVPDASGSDIRLDD